MLERVLQVRTEKFDEKCIHIGNKMDVALSGEPPERALCFLNLQLYSVSLSEWGEVQASDG